ncbi:energy transducer TonB [Asaia sp. VD9]|uniref:energy transducer TonB n=1 Tax=Asaia sp. VD9 TaxID=3081235 RepID=UPI003019AEBD
MTIALSLFFTASASAPKKPLLAYYPEDLLKKGETGDVTLACDIDTKGRTLNCRIVSSTNDHFNAAALKFAGKARYQPAAPNGYPVVEYGHILRVSYRLYD